MNKLFIYWIVRSLLFTIIIETIGALVLKVKDKKDILNVILVQIITNPLLTTISLYLNVVVSLQARNAFAYSFEIINIFVEGFIYQKTLKYKRINPYILSFLLNLFSYGIGEIINNVL